MPLKGVLVVAVVLCALLSVSLAETNNINGKHKCDKSNNNGASSSWYTVWYDSKMDTYRVGPGKDTSGVAVAEYADERFTNGWTRFNLQANSQYSDKIMAYGSGYLEGVVTAPLIWADWYNWIQNNWNGTVPSVLANFFNLNIKWMRQSIAANTADPYWQQVELVLHQLEGMQAGYAAQNKNQSQSLDILAFHILNAGGDLETLGNKFNVGNALKLPWYQNTHCSSLVKVTPDLTELYAGHTTWTGYYNMLRSFKTYVLPYATEGTAAKSTLFSSYPASLSSTDDFYQLSSNLVVMETTNGIWNNTLYNYVQPTSVLSWIRVIIANRMAVDGKTWSSIFSRYNSGTYNNQWIVVDYNKFVPGQPLQDGLLWIAEQIPGMVEAADMTEVLEYGYWPSYNVPFFPKIYAASGWDTAVKQYGPMLTYSYAPRAQIFRRDSNNVKSIDDFKNILRYNKWQTDPLSYGDPGNSICARADLEPQQSNRDASGGIDTKVTSSKLLAQGVSYAQSGPTHDNQTPFDWRVGNWGDAHMGLPDLWNFGWVSMPSGAALE